MRRAEAEKALDQAMHEQSIGRIQAQIDAKRALAEAEADADRADAERAKANEAAK